MTIAVLLPAVSTVSSDVVSWIVAGAMVALIGIGPLAGWIAAAWQRPVVKRLTLAVVFALALAPAVYAADYCCCDPFWIIFWICVAP